MNFNQNHELWFKKVLAYRHEMLILIGCITN